MTTNVSTADNINNFTASGKAAQSKADKAGTKLFSDYSQFIKLLTTQLQNQDPTKPLETDQLTQQIAQLSSVEQSVNTNKNLETLISLYSQTQTSNIVGYIGKMVEGEGNTGQLINGQGTLVYNLEKDANKVSITVADLNGNVVFNGSGTTLAGRNAVVWDGKDNDGKQMPDGTYVFSVVAKAADNSEVKSATSSYGKVAAIQTENGINQLVVGSVLLPLNKVTAVSEYNPPKIT